MKKFFVSAFALLVALTAGAQSYKLQNYTSKLDVMKMAAPATTVRMAPTRAAVADNQRLLGYFASDDCDSYLGTGIAEEQAVGICLSKDDLAPYKGTKVVGVRFNLSQGCTSTGVMVMNMSGSQLATLAQKDVTVSSPAGSQGTGTWQTVMFDEADQFELNGKYSSIIVGYGYNSTTNNKPISINTQASGDMFFYGTLDSGAGWYNLGSDNGAPCVQLIVESANFHANEVVPSDFGSFTVGLGKSRNKSVTLNNLGTSLKSIDYVVTLDGKAGDEKHIDFGKDLGFGGKYTVDIPFDAAPQTGEYPVTLTVTKVNGEANAATANSASGTNVTLAKEYKKAVVMEQFTGTGCQWCPRGHVAMHNLRQKYGDQFIGIALHQYNSSDPMYISDYGLGFSGAPEAMVDRDGKELDPYYDAPAAVAAALENLPTASVSVSGDYTADYSQVNATATVESLVPGKYGIAYMLVADGLKGTKTPWKQSNGYAKYKSDPSQVPDDLQYLCNQPSAMFTTFNDVLIASSYTDSKNNATLDELAELTPTTSTYTLTMPVRGASKLKEYVADVLQKNEVYVVAMLLDPTTGAVINAAKAHVEGAGASGIESIGNNDNGATVVARYAADGTRLSAPQKGLNILKMSDGTTRKVIVNE